MSNLATRILTAAVLLAILFSALFLLPAPSAAILFGLVVLLGGWEWSGFVADVRPGVRIGFVLVLAVLAFLPPYLVPVGVVAVPALYIGTFFWGVITLGLFLRVRPAGQAAKLFAGLITLIPAWYAVALMLSRPAGSRLFLWCLGIVATADIAAYFTGRRFGRVKLAPSISPGKTLEGLFGGLLGAALLAGLLAEIVGRPGLPFMILGLAIGAISVVGDLWVSSFKRAAGLKDSGHILPGHGGILDRIDGLLPALPLFTLVALRTEIFIA
jgi:phosphatidate cytidylyltransferase